MSRYASVRRIIDAIRPSSGQSVLLHPQALYGYEDRTFWMQWKLPGRARPEGIRGTREQMLEQLNDILAAMEEAA